MVYLLKMVIYLFKMVIYLLKIVIYLLTIAIYLLKMVIFHGLPIKNGLPISISVPIVWDFQLAGLSDLRSPDSIHLVRPALVILGEEVLAKNCAPWSPRLAQEFFFSNIYIDILLIYIYIYILLIYIYIYIYIIGI